MKKLLNTLTLVTLVTLNVPASQNPFDLNENLKKIDQDQNTLLDELKKLAQQREVAEDTANDDEKGDEDTDASEASQAAQSKQVSVVSKGSKRENTLPKAGSIKKPAPKASDRIQEVRKRMMEQEALRAKEKAAHADAKRAQKKQEMKAHKGARKAQQKAETKATVPQAVQAAASKRAVSAEAPKNKEGSIKPAKTSGVDFNIAQEQLEAKKRAKEELKKAIMEVEQED